MARFSEVKNIYIDGYAKTELFWKDFRLSKTLVLVERFIPKHPQRILDVGCGDGAFSIRLGSLLKSEEVYGIDISPNAAKEAAKHGVKATAIDIDEGNLPFKSDYFDFIFCGNLIELVLDPDHLLEELYRILSKTGHLIITFPNLCAWASRIAVALGFQPYYYLVSRRYDVGKLFIPATKYTNESKGFVRLYTLRSFDELANMYGFKIIKFWGAREHSIPGFLSLIDQLLSRIPSFAFQVICLATKK